MSKLETIYKWFKTVGHDRQVGKIQLDEVEELLLNLGEDLKKGAADEPGTEPGSPQR